METWEIRLFEPLPLVRRELVRYQGLWGGYDCHPRLRHYAAVHYDDFEVPLDSGRRIWTPEEARIPEDDLRWPARCAGAACPKQGGYVFAEDDPKYLMGARLMGEVDWSGAVVAGEVERLDALPVGAMCRAQMGGLPLMFDRERGAVPGDVLLDGDAFLVVSTPDGLWWVYLGGDAGVIGRCGRFQVDVRDGEGVRFTQVDGPPASWAIVDGKLQCSGAQPRPGGAS